MRKLKNLLLLFALLIVSLIVIYQLSLTAYSILPSFLGNDLKLVPNSIFQVGNQAIKPVDFPIQNLDLTKASAEHLAKLPKTAKTLEQLQNENSETLTVDKKITKIDVNNDGNLDLKIDFYNDENKAWYYYLLNSGKAENGETTYYLLYWYNGPQHLGEEIYFIKDYLISIEKQGRRFEMSALAYAPGKDKNASEIIIGLPFFRTTQDRPFTKQDIEHFAGWLEWARIKYESKKESVTDEQIHVTYEQAKNVIFNDGIRSGFIGDGSDSFTSLTGQSYSLEESESGGIKQIIDECGINCRYATIGIT